MWTEPSLTTTGMHLSAIALQCDYTTARLLDRLKNWGRAMLYGYVQGQTGSLEGNYRSPQRWDDPDPPPCGPLNVNDAWHVEHAVAVTPLRSHALLRAKYVYRWPDSKLQRECQHGKLAEFGLRSWDDIATALIMAGIDLEESLGQPAVVRKQRAVDYVRRLLGTPVDNALVAD